MKQRRYYSLIRISESIKLFGILLCFILFSQSCQSDDFGHEQMILDYDDPESVFNCNIAAIRQMIISEENDGIIATIDSTDSHVYVLHFDGAEAPVRLCRNNHLKDVRWPRLSVKPFGADYYWAMGDDYLLDAKRQKVLVKDIAKTPVFRYTGGKWSMTLQDRSEDLTDNKLSESFVTVITDDYGLAQVSFPSSYQITIPTSLFKQPFVPLKSFYKDIFLDAGIGLTSRKFLYAANYLGLTTECVSLPRLGATEADSIIQAEIIAGHVGDTNGRLLYPDGQPRYRLLFVDGGSSTTHGKSLSETARRNMQQFVSNGGSYVGTCAGAFFASNGYDDSTNYPFYLNLFPAVMNHTGLAGTATGMFIENDSPLLEYYDFGGDGYVSDIRHNKGGYPTSLPSGTEVLARYDYSQNTDLHLQPSAWAYKKDLHTGRVVLEGSHPEEVADGERRDLTAAMILYALDGVGTTPIKGFLQNGKTRVMECLSEDENPNHACIGDKQCHHFAVNLPQNAENVTISLDCKDKGCFSVFVNPGTFAYPTDALYGKSLDNTNPTIELTELPSGVWYVCVQYNDVVGVSDTSYGQTYNDPIGILNGMPYQLTVSWKDKESNLFIASMRSMRNPAIESRTSKQDTHDSAYTLDGIKLATPRAKALYVQNGKILITDK